jgi:hypothetical protein
MGTKKPNDQPAAAEQPPRPTKKDQIISLWNAGIMDVTDLASITMARPSYVASVLQEAGLMTGYFDLYTTTSQPMNVYSKYFANKLSFRDEESARASIDLIDRFYQQFAYAGDRAGQHHALMLALIMFNRARWTNKPAEAEIFRRWLADRLNEGIPSGPVTAAAPTAIEPARPRGKKKS